MRQMILLTIGFLFCSTNYTEASVNLLFPLANIQLGYFQNNDDLMKGLELARNAIDKKEKKLATYIYLNLINKHPDNLNVSKEYMEFIIKNEFCNETELEELLNLLNIVAFKVPPNNVKDILGFIDSVNKKKQQLIQFKEIPDDSTKEIENAAEKVLKEGEIIPHNPKVLKTLIDKTADIKEKLEITSNKFELIEAFLEELEEVYQLIQKCNYVKLCLERFDDVKDKNLDYSISLIQAAEATLPALYGTRINKKKIPEGLERELENFPKQIKSAANYISYAKSNLKYEEISEIIKKAVIIDPYERNADTGAFVFPTWESVCLKLENSLTETQKYLVEITHPDVLKKTALEINRLKDKIAKFRRDQYHTYQVLVTGNLEKTFIEYNAYKWTNPGDAKAFEILKNNYVHKIDLGLLSPDVSRIYQDIVPKLLAQLKSDKLPEWYKLCVETPKFRLEDQ